MKTTFRMLALSCTASLCVAGLAQAQVRVDAENLIFTPPTNFKVGFHSSKGPVSITEFVPGDQNVETWTEMVTVQVFRAVPATAAEFLQTIGGRFVKACTGTTTKGISTGNANGYVVSMLVLKCPNNPATGKPETTIFRAIRGGDALYLVQHAWRAMASDQDTDLAIEDLRRTVVCDTRTAEHPCSIPPSQNLQTQARPALGP